MDLPDLSRFSPNARRVMRQAQMEAQRLGHDHVGTEHLAIALAEVECRAQQILRRSFNTSGEDLRIRVEAQAAPNGGVQDSPPAGLPWSQRARKICDVARMIAESRGKQSVDTTILLFAIVTEGGLGALVLRQLGVTTESLEKFMPQTDATASPRARARRRRRPWIPSAAI